MSKHTTTPFHEPAPADTGGGAVVLVQIYGSRIGRAINVIDAVTLGRDDDNDVVIDDASVSRHHARIVKGESDCMVEDLGSTNGTAINDVIVTGKSPLCNGDRLRVGGVWFRCIAGDRLEQNYHEEIHRLVVADGLTGLHNRRFFDDFLEREVARSARRGTPLSVALIDIDHFKAINDKHGHLAGDAVLRELANRLSREIRREELLARYGGEELAVVFPDTAFEDAIGACERLRDIVAGEPFPSRDGAIAVTISIGVACGAGAVEAESLLRIADENLYAAKEAGRNLVRPVSSQVRDS